MPGDVGRGGQAKWIAVAAGVLVFAAIVGVMAFVAFNRRRQARIAAVESAVQALQQRGLAHFEEEHACRCVQDPTPGADACCPVRQLCGGRSSYTVGVTKADRLEAVTADGQACSLGAADIGLALPGLHLEYDGTMPAQRTHRRGVSHGFSVTARLDVDGQEIVAKGSATAVTDGQVTSVTPIVVTVSER